MSKLVLNADQSNAEFSGGTLFATLTKCQHSKDFIFVFKYKFRIWLYRHKNIQHHVRGVRYFLHAIKKIQLRIDFLKISNNFPVLVNNEPIFYGNFNVVDIVDRLNHGSYSYGPLVKGEIVRELIDRYSPQLARGYRNAYLQDQMLFDICHNESLISVVRAYLGFEPVVHSCCVTVDVPGEEITDSSYEEGYHYDIAGIKSLNVFIYLTNVDHMSMPHMVIKGSHNKKRLRDIYNGYLRSRDAKALYGDAITTLTGPAGTVIFENTEAFHRRGDLGSKERVFVNILYTDGNRNLM